MRSAVPDANARATGSGVRGAIATDPRGRATPLPGELLRQRRKKMLLAIGGLAGLALLSFVIALAASSSKRSRAAAAADAAPAVVQMPATPVDADEAIAPSEDPEVVAEPTVQGDAAVEPTGATVPPDAAVTAPAPVDDSMAYLAVRTIPDGGKVKVGKQTRVATVHPDDPTRVATARLLLPPGKHVVTAMLDGYRNEKRTVVLARGDHQRIEITFTKKIVQRPDRGPRPGRLTVRTTPWSDVYLGGKKLGQAPFADLELPAGTHTLTFKNPSHPTVTKTVTIRPGKSAKLNFDLP